MDKEQRCTWDDMNIDSDEVLKDLTEEERQEEFERLFGQYVNE